MTPSHGQFILDMDEGDEMVGRWETDGRDIDIFLNGCHYKVESGPDMRSRIFRFIRSFEKDVLSVGCQLRACATCRRFRVSAMSLDMAHGHIGKCELDNSNVRLCHLCDKYERV